MPTLLVVDDEPSILYFFRQAFCEPEVTLLTASSAAEGVETVRRDRPDVVILDVDLPDAPGLEAFRRVHEIDTRIPVIFITGHGTTATAIEAMRMGAYEYLLKPLELDQLTDLVERAFEISRLMRVPAVVPEGPRPEEGSDALVGRCAAMQEVYKAIGRVAPQDVTVLILGESGTGKELVARAIYHYSDRSKAPFLAINCAAIPENLLESELFGHEKGAFTGADRRRIGKFEQCHGGTLFLDEIGDMPPATQAKMLRVLQEQTFERVGGNETIRTDVRLIAATHRDLKAWSEEGKFRPDLYYRLGVFTIHLPPLRERDDDLLMLVQYYLRRFNRELGREVRAVTPEGLERLRGSPWPGNFGGLQSVLKKPLLKPGGPFLPPAFFPDPRGGAGGTAPPAPPAAEPGVETFVIRQRVASDVRDLYAETHRQLDRLLLPRVMQHTRGNLQQAALLLGIARQTLRLKLRDLGLSATPPGDAEDDAV